MTEKPHIGIIMGSDSDLPVMKQAAEVLDQMGIPYELTIVSAHRTPDRMVEYSKNAHAKGIQILIAGAGGAAHLPGMIASLTPLPVIGVPIKTKSLNGIDSLLSIAQMPPGIPVGTMAINGAKNAGILAASILGISDIEIYNKVVEYKNSIKNEVLEKAKKLDFQKYEEYLQEKE